MKELIIWLVLTALVIMGIDFYLEYCISRPCPEIISFPIGLIVLVGTAYYLIYTVKLTLKKLKA